MNENLFKALELENFSALFVSAEESFLWALEVFNKTAVN